MPNELTNIITALASLMLIAATILFYFHIIKPYQDAKNKTKQAAAERDETDKIFDGDTKTVISRIDKKTKVA